MPLGSTRRAAASKRSAWVRVLGSARVLMSRSLKQSICVGLLLGSSSCAGHPRPCMSAADCCKTAACLANQCSPIGSQSVSASSRRSVLRPIEIAAVAADDAAARLPSSVVFGSRATGPTALYLRFAPPSRAPGPLERAFLVLEPMLGAQPATRDITVTVWRVAGPWSARDLTWLDQPSTRLPASAGIARTSPPQTLRIDVTELVRHHQEHPRENRGFVLKAGTGDAFGATYSTGTTAGPMPALELYFAGSRDRRSR